MSEFHKTVISVEVLSKYPIPDTWELGYVMEQATSGDLVAGPDHRDRTTLSGPEVAEALTALGSDPSFFMLDDDGNRTED